MTTDSVSLEFELFDPITQRYLHALSIPECAVGELALVDNNHAARNYSKFRIYTKNDSYFFKDILCC